MATRTALVTGATGFLGREVVKEFSRNSSWTVKGAGFGRADGVDILKVDLSKQADLEKMLADVRPQVVVHCAANKYPESVEKDPEAARAINVGASAALARLCAEQDILMIYISTDYVFPGRPGEAPYAATDPTAPTMMYGQLKAEGEAAVLREFAQSPGREGLGVVLRVPVLYGSAEMPTESAINVLMDTVWEAQSPPQGEGASQKKVRVDHWALRYPTSTEDVGRVCRDVAAKYLDAGSMNGLPRVLQFTSEDRMTKYEICAVFAEIMGLSMDNIEPITEGGGPVAGTVQRPYNCHMSTDTLRELGISTVTCDFAAWWRRELRAFRK